MTSSFVRSVHSSAEHSFSKPAAGAVELVAGHGVLGDAHYGTTVKHRSRVARDPTQPNLRQVHLLHEELFSELRAGGFIVEPGQLGENVTTAGIALLELSEGTRLQLGSEVIVRITGLRNPCSQIEDFQSGLLRAVLGRTDSGELIRKTGVMGVVEVGGRVHPGDAITVIGVPGAHVPLQPV